MTLPAANAAILNRVLIEGGIDMPIGVYPRVNDSSNGVILAEVSRIIADSTEKLTITQIYQMLWTKGMFSNEKGIVPGKEKGYMRLYYQLMKAVKAGKLNKNAIVSGNGKPVYKLIPKFKVDDKVRIIRLNKRTPRSLMKELRLNKCRTIIAAIPSKQKDGHTLYYLGTNNLGDSYLDLHAFRSSELEFFTKKTTAGRPRTKRKYTPHCNDTSSVQSELLMNRSVSPDISCVNENKLVGVY